MSDAVRDRALSVCRDAYFRRKAEERKKEKELKKAAAKPEVVASQVRQKAAVLHFKGLTKPDTTREAIKVRQEMGVVILV